MSLVINLPQTLLDAAKSSLSRTRYVAWSVFSLALVIGLILSVVLHDVTHFSRIGSIGVVIGVIFARWRFLVLKKAERKFECALRNPHQWLEGRIRQQFPSLNMTCSSEYKTFSQEDVSGTVADIVMDLDNHAFRGEAIIIVISTIIWGYGDLIINKIFTILAL